MPKSETPKKKRKLSINGPTSQERRWQQLLEKWRLSGLPGTAFCRRRRLKESAFRFWQKEVPYRERRRQERAEALGRPATGQTFIEARSVPISIRFIF